MKSTAATKAPDTNANRVQEDRERAQNRAIGHQLRQVDRRKLRLSRAHAQGKHQSPAINCKLCVWVGVPVLPNLHGAQMEAYERLGVRTDK